MNFYQSLGFLIFGSRMRRLSETFLADVNKIYKSRQLKFDAAWFPVFYILSLKDTVSIKEMADEVGVSHSAMSQLVSSLQKKGLIKSTTVISDGRKKAVTFTPKGRKLQQDIEPVWKALVQAMENLSQEGKYGRQVLQSLTDIEYGMQQQSVFDRVEAIMNQ